MPDDWKTYRTRFMVRAKQLTEPFTFTDLNGHEHHGRPGDYVIESREGLRISRREIFEDVYVAMEAAESVPSFSPDCELVSAGGHGSIAHPTGRHGSVAHPTGGHGFSRAAANEERIGALAPVQLPSEHANLSV